MGMFSRFLHALAHHRSEQGSSGYSTLMKSGQKNRKTRRPFAVINAFQGPFNQMLVSVEHLLDLCGVVRAREG